MRIPTSLALATLACAMALPAAAQLKPGLWEINNKMNNPQMDRAMAEMQQQLAAMPPEQRKQMEAMMSQRGMQMATPGAGGGMAMRMCMTKEMADRNDVPMQDGCRMTSQQRSGNTMKMAFACTDPPSSGEGQFTFTSDQAYSSKMTIRTVAQGKTETTTMDTSGKWIGADCGSIKPPAKK